MNTEVNREHYGFDKDFKGLSVKNRVILIKTAQNLLKVQKETTAGNGDSPALSMEFEGNMEVLR